MSYRNFMIVHTDFPNNSLDNIKKELIELARKKNIGIHLNILDYHNELLELLDIKKNYFCISNDFKNVECEAIFSTIEAFEYMISLKLRTKKEREKAEQNYLIEQFSFLNDFVNVIFQKLENNITIEFYFSDQYSTTLDSYKTIIVQNRNLTKAFVQSLQPTKKDDYIGVKTTKFIIK